MAAERYRLRADREGYTYREILEAKPGSVRLLHPSGRARSLSRWTSTLFALGYIFVTGSVLGAGVSAGSSASGVPGLVPSVGAVVLFIAGLVLLLLWWEDRNLPILAENPSSAMPLEVLGVTSFGTIQELRARSDGREMRIVVHGPRERVSVALRLAGVSVPPRRSPLRAGDQTEGRGTRGPVS